MKRYEGKTPPDIILGDSAYDYVKRFNIEMSKSGAHTCDIKAQIHVYCVLRCAR